MCGILVSAQEGVEFHHRLLRSLKRRGPDEVGFWSNGHVHLAHTRLSIIGLDENAIEPMFNERYVLSYNGEIYNFLELKQRLLAKGYPVQHSNDAEVLLHAWDCWGKDILKDLHGFWAFSIFDKVENSLTLVRDQLGIKPLYYSVSKGAVVASSLLGTCLEILAGPRQLDYEAISEYARYQFTFGNKTFIKQVKKVLPSQIVTISLNDYSVKTETYDNILAASGNEALTPEWLDETSELLRECILESTISDTSYTTFCSGGIDSSLITRIAGPEVAYHCNFSDPDCNETFFAQRVVEGTDTRLFVVNADEDFNLVNRLQDIIQDFDELSIGSVILPLDNLLSQVKRRYKVILTGTGGDELFAGYVRYMLTMGECNQDNYRQLFNEVKKKESYVDRFELCHRKGNVDLFKFYEPKVEETFREEYLACDTDNNPMRAMLRFDQRFFLSGLLNIDDKMCGRHSLESRPSLLHQKLVRRIQSVDPTEGMALASGELKPLLKRLATTYLPKSIIHRKDKMGFTTPIGTFVNSSADDIRDVITGSKFRHLYDLKRINFTAKTKYSREVFGLLMLDLWLTQYGQSTLSRLNVERIEVSSAAQSSTSSLPTDIPVDSPPARTSTREQ